jgi:flagella basal body P-ring formation protein FlgA
MLSQLLFLCLLDVTVTLPDQARVGGTEMSLGQIAAVEGEDRQEVARVAALPLGYTPAPGYSRLLEAGTIARKIASELPGVEVAFKGHATRVWARTQIVRGADILAAARSAIEGRSRGGSRSDDGPGGGGPGGALHALEHPLDVEVPDGALELIGESPSGEATAENRLSVAVRVMLDGEPYRTVWTRFQLADAGEVAVLARDVTRGETIQPDAIALRAGRAGGRERQALSLEQIRGRVATRNLLAGQTLSAADIADPALVHQGDVVYFEVRKGAVAAKVQAIASQSGARGERIRVRLPSERELTGTVIARDLVRIELGGPIDAAAIPAAGAQR